MLKTSPNEGVSGPGTVVGVNVALSGTLKDQNDIAVYGMVDGEVVSENTVTVGQTAQIKGPVRGKVITVAGVVRGSIDASEKLELLETGKVFGSIAAKDLVVKSGAIIAGKVTMSSDEPDTLMFLDGTIETPQMAKITVVVDNKVRIHAYFNKLTLSRFLEVEFQSSHNVERKKIFGIFGGGGQTLTSLSRFHGKSMRIVTDPVLPLKVAGVEVSKTPLQLKYVPDSLKIITKRGTVLE